MLDNLEIEINNDAMRTIVTEVFDTSRDLIMRSIDVDLGLSLAVIALRVREAVVSTNGDLNSELIKFTASNSDLSKISEVVITRAEGYAESNSVEEIDHALKLADANRALCVAALAAIAKAYPATEVSMPPINSRARRNARRVERQARYKRS